MSREEFIETSGTFAAVGILARVLLEKLDPVGTLVLVLVAIVLTAPHILARPHAVPRDRGPCNTGFHSAPAIRSVGQTFLSSP